jgi:hypothetical protein
MDGWILILNEFRKKNQWNRSSYEGDIDFARWLLINHVKGDYAISGIWLAGPST